ncbi:hypothetical protein WJ97_13880 [Burkholderia ubonensis]|nr:hypothetical protein WJ97_13880 [Burkholderia ubonensis]
MARANAMGFIKNGKPMVIDQAFELVAAEEGHRNQHALRATMADPKAVEAAEAAGRKQWHDACHRMGWNEESQIVHLEGFLAQKGLMVEFGAYVQAAAKEEQACGSDEPSEEAVKALQTVGYTVQDSDFKQPYWEFDDEASSDFPSDEDAWADAWNDAQHRVVARTSIDRGIWDAMTEEARIALVVKTLSKSPDELMRKVADQAFEAYDFGEYHVVAANGWEWATGSTRWARTIFVQMKDAPAGDSIRGVFLVYIVDGKVNSFAVF